VPDAVELGALELAMHDADESPAQELGDLEWLRRHAVPWALRRLAGRTAGDGRSPKREALTPVAVQARPNTRSRRGPVSR
jgi:phosphatidylinositol alpha 1,6-mannosyltransferase